MVSAGSGLGFSSSVRAAGDEDELVLTSVGIDIGSSTTHLVFSRLLLKRRDSRYVVAERTVLSESAIMLTPFLSGDRQLIDADALRVFVDGQYAGAGLRRADVDTGALILTGLAVRRDNARQIGELFADDAGKFVMVTAGDGLEATMAAHGSGGVARSSAGSSCLNVDIGGGTTKLGLCVGGRIAGVTALDVGARLVVLDPDGSVARVEPAAAYLAARLEIPLSVGQPLAAPAMQSLVAAMADIVFAVATGRADGELTAELLRLPALAVSDPVGSVVFSGGVSEYVYGREETSFGDLGPDLASAVRRRFEGAGMGIEAARSGIRATALGASQYTIQVSGSTIFVDPVEALPLRNVPVASLEVDLSDEVLDERVIAEGVRTALGRAVADTTGERPVALALHWAGSATYARLVALTSGIVAGLGERLAAGNPVIVVSEGDIGGLIGMQLRESGRLASPVVSIDGVELKDFDYVDIGEMIPSSGAVPVVIKSLVFPTPGDHDFLGAARRTEPPPT